MGSFCGFIPGSVGKRTAFDRQPAAETHVQITAGKVLFTLIHFAEIAPASALWER